MGLRGWMDAAFHCEFWKLSERAVGFHVNAFEIFGQWPGLMVISDFSHDPPFPSNKCNGIKWVCIILPHVPLFGGPTSCPTVKHLLKVSDEVVWGPVDFYPGEETRLEAQVSSLLISQTKNIYIINSKKFVFQERWFVPTMWVSIVCSFPGHLGKGKSLDSFLWRVKFLIEGKKHWI